ncbi:hypothetical protein [Haloplanus halophilus]|uniref:hypothetical protein n=1 Tax=Haloplanus halophilus TaxID=2949993 RepID=UPI00203B7A3A|nr:hypothetical protein [Haloplanus sp. GDY1]
MNARHKSSLLWGLVGALSYLVLVQGYRLLVGPLGPGVLALGGVALLVAVASAGLTYVLEPRVRGNKRS